MAVAQTSCHTLSITAAWCSAPRSTDVRTRRFGSGPEPRTFGSIPSTNQTVARYTLDEPLTYDGKLDLIKACPRLMRVSDAAFRVSLACIWRPTHPRDPDLAPRRHWSLSLAHSWCGSGLRWDATRSPTSLTNLSAEAWASGGM